MLVIYWAMCEIKFPKETYKFILLKNSKDVRLPKQLQRAMAAETEATREARAKVRADSKIYYN